MTALLTPDRVTPLLRSSFGHTYRHLESAASSQDELRDDDPEGTIVVCEQQSAGRGRRGRAWLAPHGRAILMSVLLRPGDTRPVAQLSLVAGVVVAALVERELGRPTGIKWPNDVLVGRAKVSGILAERRGDAVALGLGLNVNQTEAELPPDTPIEATSLRVCSGHEHDRAALLAQLATGLEAAYRAWLVEGLGPVGAELASRDVLHGRGLRVGGVEGVGAGIGPGGELFIDASDGRRSVVAGEVEVAW